MPYDRLVRWELYRSDRWLSLPSDTHRLVFNALLHEADDFGNLEGGARRMWRWMRDFSQVRTEQDALKLMSDLADADLVRRYEVDGQEYWHMPRFKNTRTYFTRLAPPSPWCDPLAYTGSYKRVTKQSNNQKSDSGLNQTSISSDSSLKIGVGVGVGVGTTTTPATGVAFERFWKAYPRKKSKGEALKAWVALKPEDALVDQILQAVEAAKRSGDWQQEAGRFIPYPATWLRARGWLDELQHGRPEGLAL